MKMQRTYGLHFKTSLFWAAALVSVLLLTGCGNADTAGTQARSDLTSDHVRGLYSGMNRNDIEDLLGTSDKSLAEHESIEVSYLLAANYLHFYHSLYNSNNQPNLNKVL